MAKGTPRKASASQVMVSRIETPEQKPYKAQVTVYEDEPQPKTQTVHVRTVTEGGGTFPVAQDAAYTPAKRGVKQGLREGETRITCIYREDQSQVLHDWAKTTGRTFREVCIAMASRYIEEVIRPATSGEKKLKRGYKEPPEAYEDLYEAEESADEWARYF